MSKHSGAFAYLDDEDDTADDEEASLARELESRRMPMKAVATDSGKKEAKIDPESGVRDPEGDARGPEVGPGRWRWCSPRHRHFKPSFLGVVAFHARPGRYCLPRHRHAF